MIVIEAGHKGDPAVARLLREGRVMMEALFPTDPAHYLRPEDLTRPDVHLFTARVRGDVVGTGALVVKPSYGEVKSLFVDESARGIGVADALLRQIEDQARALKLPLLRLETGNSLNSALRLYARHGFDFCDAFGDYEQIATSLFMEKRLD